MSDATRMRSGTNYDPEIFKNYAGLCPSPVDAEIRAHSGLLARYSQVIADLTAAKARIPHAQAEDREAASAAFKANKPDPGNVKEDKAHAEVERLTRLVIAASDAVADAHRAFMQAMADNRPEWMAQVAEEQARTRAALQVKADEIVADLRVLDRLAVAAQVLDPENRKGVREPFPTVTEYQGTAHHPTALLAAVLRYREQQDVA